MPLFVSFCFTSVKALSHKCRMDCKLRKLPCLNDMRQVRQASRRANFSRTAAVPAAVGKFRKWEKDGRAMCPRKSLPSDLILAFPAHATQPRRISNRRRPSPRRDRCRRRPGQALDGTGAQLGTMALTRLLVRMLDIRVIAAAGIMDAPGSPPLALGAAAHSSTLPASRVWNRRPTRVNKLG